MTHRPTLYAQLPRIQRYTLLLALIWTIIIATSAACASHNYNQSTINAARIEAKSTFNKDILYRRWASLHGGVYVPVTDYTPPNPYLDVANRNITTTDGQSLTLVNPAYMTRQVHELSHQLHGTQGRITSLDPIRPGNAPDDWERAALLAFEQGMKEVSSIEMVNGEPTLRYMQGMVTEESCMACHAIQGYQMGDIRGGISVSVPMEPYWAAQRPIQRSIFAGHGALWLFGIFGILLGSHRMKLSFRREAEAAQQLREANQRYDELVRNIPLLVYRLRVTPDRQFRFDYLSPTCEKYTGVSAEDGMRDATLIHSNFAPADLIRHWELTEESMRTLSPFVWEGPMTIRGQTRWIRLQSQPTRLENGDVIWDGIHIDITERKQAEAELRTLHRAIDFSSAGIAIVDARDYANLPVVYMNDAFSQITGYEPSELIGQNIRLLNRCDRQQPGLDELRRAIREQRPCTTVVRAYRKDGTLFWNEIRLAPVFDDAGQLTHLVTTQTDVTTQKQAEEALADQYTELNRFFTVALDLLCIADTDGHFVKVNKAWENLLGYSAEELEGRLFLDLVHPDDYQATLDATHSLKDGDQIHNFTNRYRTRDGDYRTIEWRSNPHGERIYAAAHDITERQQMEDALRESEARYKLLSDLTFEGIALHDRGIVYDMNPALGRMFGYERDELIGRQAIDLLFTPQSQATISENIGKQHAAPYEVTGIRKDGSHFPVMIEARQMTTNLRVTSLRDITEQKEAEKRNLELTLEKERRRILTTFIQDAAHEFRTPLSTISTSAYLMVRADAAERRDLKAQQINAQVQQITKLVDMLLLMVTLESNGSLANRLVDMDSVIRNAVEIAASICPDGCKHLRLDIPPDLPPVMGDAGHLVEAFRQILDNACRYTPPDGLIEITAGSDDNTLCITVQDSGPGIPPDQLPKIFETFWRQNVAHTTPGFGLGLSIARNIIERHNGRIEVESEEGSGTTFRVMLPRSHRT